MTRPQAACSAAALAALTLGVVGCSTRSNVSAIGNTAPLYSHVYVTAQAVWFNGSATAGPDDGGWTRFTLSTPVTVDLVTDSGTNFANLVTDLKLAPGSYSQVRLIPLDASAPLSASAQALGAQYNMEADIIDGGVTRQLPLELLNPDKGLGIPTSLTVPIGNIGAALGAGALAGTGTTNGVGTTNGFGSTGGLGTTNGCSTVTGFGTGTSGAVDPTTGLPVTSPAGCPSTGAGSTTTTAEFTVGFDGVRDLVPFTYAGTNAILLSSHESAYDLSRVGGIQGQLTLTNLTLTSANGTPGIEVSAEVLSSDGSRHVVVASSPVASDGTFTLYPLPTGTQTFNAFNTSNLNYSSYDLVIHGAGIATIIIKAVQIPDVASSSSSSFGSTPTVTGTTTGSSLTTTNPDLTPIQPSNLVSVGTLLPRAVSSYTANIANASAPLPAGAAVGFYQTLPGSGEVPYLIEAAPIDPFNQVLGNAQALSSGTVDSGTYVSSAGTVTLVSTAPQEQAGTYQVAATAPSYTDGAFGVTVSAPTTTGVTSALAVTLQPLSLASGVAAASLAATITPASPGKYDQGEIMLSRNGQLIASAALDAALQAGGGTVTLSAVPGGTSSGLYYLTVRAWSSGNPTAVQTRQWYPAAVDLRSASSASVDLTVN
ncbi:MAG TPA: DUF4382 domain-containing protein [Steroidobacteraceae bacterium]|nr:DUF4382 domain-containing protein [Steroidobacteraceae bacterium]